MNTMIKGIGKVVANRGVARNKRPLQNILYKIEFSRVKEELDRKPEYAKYKFKEEGYLILLWAYERDFNEPKPIGGSLNWHGFVTPEELKERIGEKQWAKFCQGKREFVIQRRIDGKNISKEHQNSTSKFYKIGK